EFTPPHFAHLLATSGPETDDSGTFSEFASSAASPVSAWMACRAAAAASSLGLGRRKSRFILLKNSSAEEFGCKESSGLDSRLGSLGSTRVHSTSETLERNALRNMQRVTKVQLFVVQLFVAQLFVAQKFAHPKPA